MSKKKKILSNITGRLKYLQEEGINFVSIQKKNAKKETKKVQYNKTKNGSKKERLMTLFDTVQRCKKCSELVKNRTQVVFGAGNANAQLMFVGEAPGRDEDIQGLPFVGRAGQLLTKMIESIGFERRQVFIANVLKCRPPQNRNPLPDEIMNCEAYLLEQVDIIRPKILCALGTFAAQTLLKTDVPISSLRGRFHDYHGIKLIPTFHPAYLLRNPSGKQRVWIDLKMIKKELNKA